MTNVVSLESYRNRVSLTRANIVKEGNELFYGLLDDLANNYLLAAAACTFGEAFLDEDNNLPTEVSDAIIDFLAEITSLEQEIHQLISDTFEVACKFHDEVYE